MEHLERLNSALIHESVMASLLVLLTFFYFYKRNVAFDVTFLLTILVIIDILMLPIAFNNTQGYIWCYAAWVMEATFIFGRLMLRIKMRSQSITFFEVAVIILQCFIVLCILCKFIDFFVIGNVAPSEVYQIIIRCSNYLILLILLMPMFLMILKKFDVDDYLLVLRMKAVSMLFVNISSLFNKRG